MTILDEIVEVKKEEVAILHRDFTISQFTDSQFFNTDNISLYERIKKDQNVSIIAEIKKASPSKGIIREEFNHIEIAKQYMDADVAGISVLTDVNFFQGSIKFLNEIASFKSVPLLRKDFIIDEYQVYEAKANGADVVLLICEILSPTQVKELTHAAKELKLEVLLELHSIDQLPKIDFGTNNIVGINNRDLKTFKVDIDTSIEISKLLPNNIAVIGESGFSSKLDVDKIRNEKIDGLLVGEHFMRNPKIVEEVAQFKEWCRRES